MRYHLNSARAVETIYYIMMSAEKMRTAYTLQTDVNLALCVCVCVCARAASVQELTVSS